MRCQACQYDLSRLIEKRCPECGRAFDPADPQTLFEPEPRSVFERVIVIGVLLFIVGPVIALLLVFIFCALSQFLG